MPIRPVHKFLRFLGPLVCDSLRGLLKWTLCSILVERLAGDVVDQLDSWVAPDWLAHLDGSVGGLLCALNVIKLNRRRHLLRVPIDADNFPKLSEVSVDIDNIELLGGHVLDVDGVAPCIDDILRLGWFWCGSPWRAPRGSALVAGVAIDRHGRSLLLH